MISANTTHAGLVRTENQDALGYIKVGTNDLFVICDGVGGLPNSALVSKTTLDSIIAGCFWPNGKKMPHRRNWSSG